MITDLTSFLIISCYTKFRFGERGAQCILGEGGPLSLSTSGSGNENASLAEGRKAEAAMVRF